MKSRIRRPDDDGYVAPRLPGVAAEADQRKERVARGRVDPAPSRTGYSPLGLARGSQSPFFI
jgi:hypothetical protein